MGLRSSSRRLRRLARPPRLQLLQCSARHQPRSSLLCQWLLLLMLALLTGALLLLLHQLLRLAWATGVHPQLLLVTPGVLLCLTLALLSLAGNKHSLTTIRSR